VEVKVIPENKSGDMFDLKGRVAIVTGGNGGIGFGIAHGLARAGARIIIAARNEDKSGTAVLNLQAMGFDALSV
jgi:2-deoxy-D-gluconate 3-dehydrogenase